MKKILSILLTLLFLNGAWATANAASAESVVLDSSAIIAGEKLYYSGSVDGGESGVFMMNADGSDPERISESLAGLLAESNGNLLIYMYESDDVHTSLAVLRADGTLQPLEGIDDNTVIAADGRFFWGAGSCAEDGSDLQIYFSGDNINQYDYYPLVVNDGFLYYMDWSEMSGLVFFEGVDQPQGAALCRMRLTDRSCEVISGVGTHYLGIEDGKIFYTRTNFWKMNDSYDAVEVAVDEGLFSADLVDLSETCLAKYPDDSSNEIDSYSFVKNGVIYGMRSVFSEDGTDVYSVLRIRTDGTELDDVVLSGNAWGVLHCVKDDVLYLSECHIESNEDDFIQKDRIISVNLSNNVQTVLNPDSIDMLFYSEGDPAVAVVGSRIYYSAYDMERWAISLKSMNVDGSDLRLLAYGVSSAEG